MMKIIPKSRIVLVAILSCALLFTMSVGALGADIVRNGSGTDTPTVTLSDSGNHAVFSINRPNADLFDNFKSVMPGDTLTQTVTVRTEAGNSSGYNIYLYARESEESKATLPADDKASVLKQSEFLQQLNLKVTIDGRTVDLVAAGPGTAGVHLGQFAKSGATKDVLVTLEVPSELGNEFANTKAYTDWFFYAQGIEEGSTGGNTGGNTGGGGGSGGGNETPTDPPNVDITDPEVPLGNVDLEDQDQNQDQNQDQDQDQVQEKDQDQVEIADDEVPLAALAPVSDIPQTGDETKMALWATVSVLSGSMLVFLLTGLKKKDP